MNAQARQRLERLFDINAEPDPMTFPKDKLSVSRAKTQIVFSLHLPQAVER